MHAPSKGSAALPVTCQIIQFSGNPEGAEQDENWQALEALKNESTLEERAENFKVQGNNKLKVGLQAENKHVLREAIEFYVKGLALKCSDDRLNSILLSNKAHVESLIGELKSKL